jgi:hypothetical protein
LYTINRCVAFAGLYVLRGVASDHTPLMRSNEILSHIVPAGAIGIITCFLLSACCY